MVDGVADAAGITAPPVPAAGGGAAASVVGTAGLVPLG